MNAPQQTRDEIDAQTNIRSDMWLSMSMSQLARQQEIVIEKISLVHRMLGGGASPSVHNIYGALQVALQDLNKLIDSRTKRT